MSGSRALLVFSILLVAVVLLNGVASSDQPAIGSSATNPAVSKTAATQPAYPLWDSKESVGNYANRVVIKDIDITLDLDGNVTMKLVLIPAGKFLMGSPDSEKDRLSSEGPQHEVTITKPFYMGVYHVTQEQYELVMGKNPSLAKGAKRPVEMVSWDDAVDFCKKVSQKTGKTVRLPTEAEWEYSCRAGSTTRFCFGDDAAKLDDYGWYNLNAGSAANPVGQLKPNAWGLYDMHGNVWQWCSDWYADSYANAGKTDPKGPDSGTGRVLRGGGYESVPESCRSAYRGYSNPSGRYTQLGFRVAVDLK